MGRKKKYVYRYKNDSDWHRRRKQRVENGEAIYANALFIKELPPGLKQTLKAVASRRGVFMVDVVASLMVAYVNDPASFRVLQKCSIRTFVKTNKGGRLVLPEDVNHYEAPRDGKT